MSAAPGIVTLQVERASWDAYANSYYVDDLGENALLTIRLSLGDASAAGNFMCDLSWREQGSADVLGTCRICVGAQYRRRAKSGGRVVSYGYSDLFEGVTRDYWMLYSKVFYAELAYEFTCTYSDGNETATETFLLEEVPANMHLSGTGKGVAFGKYSAAAEGAPLFECAYPAVFSEAVAVPAGGLLKVVTAEVTGNVSTGSPNLTGTVAVSPGDGWTPLCAVGYYASNAALHPYRLYVTGSSCVINARYHGSASSATSVTARAYVLCVRTGV